MTNLSEAKLRDIPSRGSLVRYLWVGSDRFRSGVPQVWTKLVFNLYSLFFGMLLRRVWSN
jgi:hypothetical protein